MKLPKSNKLALTGFLATFVFMVAVALTSTRTKLDNRNFAAGSGEVEEAMTTSPTSRAIGSTFNVDMTLKKTASRAIPVSGAQAVVTIPTNIFMINSATCNAPFNGTPFVNINGSTVTLFCALSPGSTPVSLSSTPVSFGSVNLTVRSDALTGPTTLIFTNTRATEAGIANQSPDVSTIGTNLTITIAAAGAPTPTQSALPSNTSVPATPTIMATVTPSTSDTSSYTIDIGNKDALSITIGAGNFLRIRFKAILQHVEGHPDLILRLRAKDDLAFTSTVAPSIDTCQVAGTGSYDYYIPAKADSNGVYTPNAAALVTVPAGITLATVESDGWVRLPGLLTTNYYTFVLKAPKTRGTKMAAHVKLVGDKSPSDDFDWTLSTLYPGDLPDPNNSDKQDCIVNAIDLSLMVDRQSKTDQVSDDVADVTYDNVVNGNDISKVVNTLSTKPDDD